jgi:hypothetical protein
MKLGPRARTLARERAIRISQQNSIILERLNQDAIKIQEKSHKSLIGGRRPPSTARDGVLKDSPPKDKACRPKGRGGIRELNGLVGDFQED